MKRVMVLMLMAVTLVGDVLAAQPLRSQVVRMPLLASQPYAWTDEKGLTRGIYPDIAGALAKTTKLDIQVEVVPFARAATLVTHGAADATFMFSNAFTVGKAVESVVIFNSNQVVQMRPGLTVMGRPNLAALSLGRMNGGCAELADDKSADWHFQELNTQESGIRMLLAARIDGFCTSSEAVVDAIAAAAAEAKFQGVQRLVLASKPVWLLLSPQLPPKVAQQLTAGIRSLQKSGELAKIFKRQLGENYVLSVPK